MVQDAIAYEVPTRRDFAKSGSVVVGGGLLAGCSGVTPPTTPAGNSTDVNSSEGGTDSDPSYAATMSPVGYVDGEPYPEIPEEEQLFDRQRVADIIDGDFSQ